MGKKKERAAPGPGKRRTVLQIDGGSSTGSSSMSTKKGYGQSSGGNALSGLMANYGDSDDDQEMATPEYVDFNEPKETAKKPKTAMDVKLADFLAEIDAMDTASNSPIGDGDGGDQPEEESIDGKPVDTPEVGVALATEGGAGDQALAGSELEQNSELKAVGEWQELLDENTNCVYYWNMYSNEVTWEMPEAFKLQQQQLVAGVAPPSAEADSRDIDGTEVSLPPTASVTEGSLANVTNGDIDGVEIPNGNLEEDHTTNSPELEPETAKEEIEKLPVYGSATVKYSLDPVPDELAEIVKDDLKVDDSPDHEEEEVEEEEKDAPVSKDSKSSYLTTFSKSETLPGSMGASQDQPEQSDEKANDERDDESDESDDGRYDLYHDDESVSSPKETKKEKDELYSVDMFADDVDDIDKQLELALEKKKAELKELEDAEAKVSPEPVKVEKGKKRKPEAVDMASIYDESGGVDLSRFKKKRLENLAGKQKSGKQDTGVQCNLEEELTPEERDKAKKRQKAKEESERKDQIVELVSVMMNKLDFLGISNKGLNKFQVMLIEMETRIQDWREGLLESKHLLQRLESSDWELQRYENDAAPRGWLCSWDRTHKQYYYTNVETNESQWEYPAEAAEMDTKAAVPTTTMEETRSAFSSAADRGLTDEEEEDESSGDESMDEGDGSDDAPSAPKPSEIEPPDLPTSQPPPPPMPSEDGDAPLPPPPLPDGPPPPPPPGEEPDLPPLPPSPPPSTPPAPPEDVDPARPLTPPPFLATLPGVHAPPPPPPSTKDTSSSSAVIGKPQVLYAAPAAVKSGAMIAAAPVLSAAPSAVSAPPTRAQPVAPPVKTKVKKKKKKEKESKLVKSKLPHSLVSKWTQIKVEQEKEMEESEESEEEDVSVRNKKMIDEWKKEQLTRGKTKYNANFEQIQGNWRERLKRKSTAQ